MPSLPVQIRPNPGIQRDGTQFDSDSFVDAVWTRFYRQRPKKINGYSSITSALPEIARTITSYTTQSVTRVHLGGEEYLIQVQVNSSGSLAGLADRTPAALAADPDRLWQFEVFYDSVGGNNVLVAHAPPNLNDISNDVETPIYVGDVTDTAVLVDSGVASESGGIAAIPPYLFKFGNNGHVGWSIPNDPSDFAGAGSGEAWITPAKIIKAVPLRSGGSGPAALFWSLDSLIRGSFVGGAAIWLFDTITSDTSIMSSSCVVEYNSNYYWVGVDQFLMFNGTVREVENNTNLDWFFANLNVANRQKVFGFKVPRYGEIWWVFPKGDSTEPNHAIIFNVRTGVWYDTPYTEGGRGAGLYAKVYNKPFMTGVVDTGSGYDLWQHETGLNSVRGSDIEPILASFQTNELSLIAMGDSPKNKALRISRLEPDFVQAGPLRLTVKGRANARSTNIDSTPFDITDVAADWEEQTVPLKETRRLLSLHFESNAVDGNFYMGKTIAHIEEADGRETQ
jgi:hypothetical protein